MDMPPDMHHTVPALAGSATALLFVKQRSAVVAVASVMAGAVLAIIMGPWAASVMRCGPEVAGYVTGLFGLAIASRGFDIIREFDAKAFARAIIKRVRG